VYLFIYLNGIFIYVLIYIYINLKLIVALDGHPLATIKTANLITPLPDSKQQMSGGGGSNELLVHETMFLNKARDYVSYFMQLETFQKQERQKLLEQQQQQQQQSQPPQPQRLQQAKSLNSRSSSNNSRGAAEAVEGYLNLTPLLSATSLSSSESSTPSSSSSKLFKSKSSSSSSPSSSPRTPPPPPASSSSSSSTASATKNTPTIAPAKENLSQYAWWHPVLSRDDSKRVIGSNSGTFLIRPSSKKGCYALDVIVGGKFLPLLIETLPNGRYKLIEPKKETGISNLGGKDYRTLNDLVTRNLEFLRTPLRKSSYLPPSPRIT
jgi:hypothetical protein